jgi:hypothetical protein
MSLPNSFASRNFELSAKSNTAICEDCMKKRGRRNFFALTTEDTEQNPELGSE